MTTGGDYTKTIHFGKHRKENLPNYNDVGSFSLLDKTKKKQLLLK